MKKTGKNILCLICNTSFYLPLWQDRRSATNYCSKKCKGLATRGVSPSAETLAKRSKALKGLKHNRTKPAWNKGIKYEAISGDKHPNWKGGITEDGKRQRNLFRQTILKQVLERDNYTCQMCNDRGGYLHVDHIQPWAEYVEGRFDMKNCRTLCVPCHYQITWGKPMPKDMKTWGHNFRYNWGEGD